MNLKIVIPSVILGSGGITAGSYLVFSNHSELKGKGEIFQKEESQPIVAEYIVQFKKDGGEAQKICTSWKGEIKGSGDFVFGQSCQKILEKFDKDSNNDNFKGLIVNKQHLYEALKKQELLEKDEEEINDNKVSWSTKKGLQCNLKEDKSESNSKIIVKCISNNGYEVLDLSFM